jgi:hypothetical protein
MADVVNTVGVSDKASGWRHDIRCPSIIRICSDRNVGPFWANNITSNFIQDHAPQFVFGLEYLWHYALQKNCGRLGVQSPDAGLTTRAEAGYGLG